MSQPNQYEQQMLELINLEREAAGLEPLIFNSNLNSASETHSRWMLDVDVFSHEGDSGSSSRDRIEDAGYELEGNWRTGENIAWVSEDQESGYESEVVLLHENLMKSPEHRANILNPEFQEIGIGIEGGEFTSEGREVDAVFVTQNFGVTSASSNDEDVEAVQSETPVDAMSFDFDLSASGVSLPENAMITTGSSVSRVEVNSVADTVSGLSVDVAGEGNFSGGGTASTPDLGSLTVTDAAAVTFPRAEPVSSVQPSSGVEPASAGVAFRFADFGFEMPENAMITTGSSVSRVEVNSVADTVSGLSVDVAGEGNFNGAGSASTPELRTLLENLSSSGDVQALFTTAAFQDFSF